MLGTEPPTRWRLGTSSQPRLVPRPRGSLITSGICPLPLHFLEVGLLHLSFTAKSKETQKVEGGAQSAPGWPCLCEGNSLREVLHPQEVKENVHCRRSLEAQLKDALPSRSAKPPSGNMTESRLLGLVIQTPQDLLGPS